MFKRWTFFVRCVLGLFFIFAATMKVRSNLTVVDPKSKTIYAMIIPPGSFVDAAIIFGEATLGFWLISGLRTSEAAVVALTLLSVYSGVLGRELTKAEPVPCGCLGVVASSDQMTVRRNLWFAIGRNGLLMAGGVWLLLSKRPPVKAPADATELVPATV